MHFNNSFLGALVWFTVDPRLCKFGSLKIISVLRCLFKVAFLGHWINWLCHKFVKVHQEFHRGIIFMSLEKPSFVLKKVWASLNYVSLILLELVDMQLCQNVRWRQVIYKWNSVFWKKIMLLSLWRHTACK